MTLGEAIKQYRDEHNLSQREFARKCGLSNVAIAAIENGFRSDGKQVAPKFETVRKIARAMGTSAETLIVSCEDFLLDISNSLEETPEVKGFIPEVKGFISEMQSRQPDEEMLLQAYRLIPSEHRIEAMQAVFRIKDKYND